MIELLNEAGGRWASYFGLALVQNTIFLLFVFAALRLMRNASAGARYAVAMVGLIKLVLPPFLKLPDFADSGQVLPSSLNGFSSFGIPFADGVPAAVADAPPFVGFAGALLIIWVVGAAIASLLSVFSTLRLAWRLRGARPVAVEQSEALGVPATIRIHLSPRIAMPLTLGMRPRKIYVPAAWNEWSEECRRMILRHEMAHIQRADGLAMLIQSIARAIYFFHPLLYWLQNRLHECREMACDESSIAPEENAAVDYSRTLVNVAETALSSAACYESASALVPRRHELSKRVDYLMKGRAMRSHSRARIGWIVACLVLLVLPLSWYDGEVAPRSVDVQAAPIAGEGETEKSERKGVTIDLTEGGGVNMEGESTEVTELGEAFVRHALELDEKNLEDMVIHLRCEAGVTMKELRGVHQILTKLNLTKVNYGGMTGAGLPLQLPAKEMIARLDELPEKDVAALEVKASGEMVLAGQKVVASEVASRIASLLEENPLLVVTIHTDSDTRYEHFVVALGEAKKGGARRIVVHPPPPPKHD